GGLQTALEHRAQLRIERVPLGLALLVGHPLEFGPELVADVEESLFRQRPLGPVVGVANPVLLSFGCYGECIVDDFQLLLVTVLTAELEVEIGEELGLYKARVSLVGDGQRDDREVLAPLALAAPAARHGSELSRPEQLIGEPGVKVDLNAAVAMLDAD